jgi:hypothetical protein
MERNVVSGDAALDFAKVRMFHVCESFLVRY